MTDSKIALPELVEQEADADLVHAMQAFTAERMVDLEIEAKTGLPAGTRSRGRLNQATANVRADRTGVPELRNGSCFPNVLEPRRVSASTKRCRTLT